MACMVVTTPDEAVKDIRGGSIIGVAHWAGIVGCPLWLEDALWRKAEKEDLKDFSIFTNGPGFSFTFPALTQKPDVVKKFVGDWMESWVYRKGRVKKIWYDFYNTVLIDPNIDSPLKRANRAGEVEMEVTPLGLLALKVVAGAWGVPAFYSPYKRQSGYEDYKERRFFDGKPYYLEESISLDYGLVKAHKADTLGNLVFRGVQGAFGETVAKTAKFTIAEVDEIVEAGELDPEVIHTPGIFIDRVVKVPPEPPESLLPRELYEELLDIFVRHLDWESLGWKAHEERVKKWEEKKSRSK